MPRPIETSSGTAACLVLLALLGPAAASAQLAGVAASRRTPVIAVWSADTVWISRDDGASFAEVLGPPAGTSRIVGAALDDDGTLLVAWQDARGDAIVELARPGGARSGVPARGVRAVAAGGGTRAVLGEDALLVAGARGAWTTLPHAAACPDCDAMVSSAALAVDSHGEVVLTDVEINTCGSSDLLLWQRTGRARPGETSVRWAASALPAHAGGATMRPGVFGWSYGVTIDGTIWARSATRVAPLTALGRGGGYEPLDLATNGRITLLLWQGRLLRLRGSRVIELDDDVGDVLGLAVDARGRALAIDAEGGLVRFSRRGGWARVLAPPT